MKYLLILSLLFSVSANAEYEFEKSKFRESQICESMVGTWFTDITTQNSDDGLKRDITMIRRDKNGTAYLKGLSIYFEDDEISPWEFSSKWSCDEEWYVEANEWGYTAFKILELEGQSNILIDERNNYSAPSPLKITEQSEFPDKDLLKSNRRVAQYFGL